MTPLQRIVDAVLRHREHWSAILGSVVALFGLFVLFVLGLGVYALFAKGGPP